MVFYRIVSALPGSEGTKVFLGTTLALGLCAVTFYGGQKKKEGHGAFDLEKPQEVAVQMEAAEKERLKKIAPLLSERK